MSNTTGATSGAGTWVYHPDLVGFEVLNLYFSYCSVLWTIVNASHCLSVCSVSFGHCIVFPTICSFLIPLWYLQFSLQSTNQKLSKKFELKIWSCISWCERIWYDLSCIEPHCVEIEGTVIWLRYILFFWTVIPG